MNWNPSPKPDEWRNFAACKGQTSDQHSIWFPTDLRDPCYQAKNVCRECIVSEECLDYHMRNEGNDSAWVRAVVAGGMTPVERVKFYRQRKKKKPTPAHAPEIRECACGCDLTFDAWRTVEGKPRTKPRVYATRECQFRVLQAGLQKQPRFVTCKLERCNVIFDRRTTYAGKPGNTPRVYCERAHQIEGVSQARLQQKRAQGE